MKTPAEAAAEADIVMILTPDTGQAKLYRDEIAPGLKPGNTLMFAHGFNIRFGTIDRAPGRRRLDDRAQGPRPPGARGLQGGPGHAGPPRRAPGRERARRRPTALAYAKGIGCTRAGVIETTFAEETETDLFGEQAVLCGGASALVKAGFETLVKNGYQPEIAYFECMHELKLIVDLMYRGGLNYMRYSVSDTAEDGDYTAGPRLVTDETKKEMQRILDEIKDGRYAKRWVAENEAGRPVFEATRAAERSQQLEQVGARLRAMMPFLDAVEVTAEGEVKRAADKPAGAVR